MTIYALSSGSGISGIAVIRVSGPETKNVVVSIIKGKFPKPRFATYKKFYSPETKDVIDEGVVLWFPKPNSYTGEDMAEFHVHGSRAVIDAIHKCISNINNCRLAEPGEFTKIAFQNGKINLLKAESISDLIASETEIQRHQAIKLMSGVSALKFNELREKLIKILSNIEAKIDFPEEELPNDIVSKIKEESKNIRYEIKKILNDQKVGEKIREGFKIAIIGPPNVGKSSLLNYLSKKDAAIVSEIAGTTRDVIETHLNLDGYPVIISDTAGIRDSNDEIEKKGIKLALKKAEEADLKIILLDPKSTDFKGFLDDLADDKTLIVVNKSDLQIKNIVKEINKYNPLYISIKDEVNLDSLINKIKEILKDKFLDSENVLISRSRHRENLKQCVMHLENFEEKNSSEDFDKAAEDLRLATRHLGMIVGKVDVEEILASIFKDFCIGK